MNYLYGPFDRTLPSGDPREDCARGECLRFGENGDLRPAMNASWPEVERLFPADWRPEFIALWPAYRQVPDWVWKAPIPIVALAADWQVLWHQFRDQLRQADMILTDLPGVEALNSAGFDQARTMMLYGLDQRYQETPLEEPNRDIDVLFVGNLHAAIQRERLPSLARVAQLSDRWNVRIAIGIFGDAYRDLTRRSRIVFNRSVRGECNMRAFEAPACGALLFQEAGNREIDQWLDAGTQYIGYTDVALMPLIEEFLADEPRRRRIAESARERVLAYSFDNLWRAAIEQLQIEWPAILERVQSRMTRALEMRPVRPIPEVLARLGSVEQLAREKKEKEAVDAGRSLLLDLESPIKDIEALCEAQPWRSFDLTRVEWERAAWSNIGDSVGEAKVKLEILRWRLHLLLAELTGDLAHRYEAVLARPDLLTSRAALGCALARANRLPAAIPHLRQSVEGNPFDLVAARAYFQSLLDAGQYKESKELKASRRRLAKAAPGVVRVEDWFAESVDKQTLDKVGDGLAYQAPALKALKTFVASTVPEATFTIESSALSPMPPAGVSLTMIVRNEEGNLADCLACVRDLVDEIVILDTGSTDRTKEIAAGFGAKVANFPWIDHFAAARNEALKHATGRWVFWLDADDRLDEPNRQKLKQLFAALPEANVAYSMKCRCVGGRTETLVDHVRLFRNDASLRWEHRVHEQILPSIRRGGGEIRFADVEIQHVGYADPNLRAKKLERDVRLLNMELVDQPNHPFTLFNVGQVYRELGRSAEALPHLQKSLAQSHWTDSIVRKLHALIAACLRDVKQPAEAVKACVEGRKDYPDDPELLYIEAISLEETGDLVGAESCLRRLVDGNEAGDHFASINPGLRGYLGRNQLAWLLHCQKRHPEAESQWRVVLTEEPEFIPAWQGLGELYLQTKNWAALDQVAEHLREHPDAAVLRGRAKMARKEYAAARWALSQAAERFPTFIAPRVFLSHAILQEGADWRAAEQALRDVLNLDPSNREAKNNLEVLLREHPHQ